MSMSVALMGALGSPDFGDEAILYSWIDFLGKTYGSDCKIYVFTKDTNYLSLLNSGNECQVIPLDFIDRISVRYNYSIPAISCRHDVLLRELRESSQDPDLEIEYIRRVFSEISVLHIIGGSYLNSTRPDMVQEVLFLTRLARFFQVKYVISGVSSFPLDTRVNDWLEEIYKNAELVDYSDDTCPFKELETYQKTLDDVFLFHDGCIPGTSGDRFCNIAIHKWSEETDPGQLRATLIRFMEQCIQQRTVDYFNILGFSPKDLEFWEDNREDINERLKGQVRYINLYAMPFEESCEQIASAAFNIGSRFHLAVFSMKYAVPVFSIVHDEYHKNKIRSVHDLFHSQEYCLCTELSEERLEDFRQRLQQVRALFYDRSEVDGLIEQKRNSVKDAYGIEPKTEESTENDNDTVKPKISVIIPVYNVGPYIKKCMESLLSQSLTEWEAVCLDDGSSDNSLEILSEYAANDSRIRVYHHENHGVSFTRNRGIALAKGEYLFFLDPDDWIHDDDVLSDLYTAAIDHNVKVCGGSFQGVYPDKVVDKWEGSSALYTFHEDRLMTYDEFQFDYGWVRFIYEREMIVKSGLRIPERTFYEDPVFFVQVMDVARTFYALRRTVYCYRTGYKSSDLSYAKVLDLVRGITDILVLAKDKGYSKLEGLELSRLSKDYAGRIVPYLTLPYANDLRELMIRLNNIVSPRGGSRVEYEMYRFLLDKERNATFKAKEKEKNSVSKLKSSVTWKIGRVFTIIPGLIKKAVKKIIKLTK